MMVPPVRINDALLISVPKTGTTSLWKSLGLLGDYPYYNHMPARLVLAKEAAAGRTRPRLFTFTRNPYSRMVSWFYYHRDHPNHAGKCGPYIGQTFESWVLAGMPSHYDGYGIDGLHQTDFLCDSAKTLLVDWCGPLEHADDSLRRLCCWLQIPPRPLVKSNSMPHPPWQDHYRDARVREAVFARCADDFAILGYSVEVA